MIDADEYEVYMAWMPTGSDSNLPGPPHDCCSAHPKIILSSLLYIRCTSMTLQQEQQSESVADDCGCRSLPAQKSRTSKASYLFRTHACVHPYLGDEAFKQRADVVEAAVPFHEHALAIPLVPALHRRVIFGR